MFVGHLRYGLPAVHNVCWSNFRDVESVQTQAVGACLGLPKCTSNIGTLCEARVLSPAVLRRQATLRLHLRQPQHDHGTLANAVDSRPHSGYPEVVAQ